MRAPRFPLEFPLRYRSHGSRPWIVGTTENIGRSGVLFRADRMVDVATDVEIQVTLVWEGGRSNLRCSGRVVRAEQGVAQPSRLAVAFLDSELEPVPGTIAGRNGAGSEPEVGAPRQQHRGGDSKPASVVQLVKRA